MKPYALWKRFTDWLALVAGTAESCPRCGGAARNDSHLGAQVYVCRPCEFGFTKHDVAA